MRLENVYLSRSGSKLQARLAVLADDNDTLKSEIGYIFEENKDLSTDLGKAEETNETLKEGTSVIHLYTLSEPIEL